MSPGATGLAGLHFNWPSFIGTLGPVAHGLCLHPLVQRAASVQVSADSPSARPPRPCGDTATQKSGPELGIRDRGIGQVAALSSKCACRFPAAAPHSHADKQDGPGRVAPTPSLGLLFQSYRSTRCTLGQLVSQAYGHQLDHCYVDASLFRTVSKHKRVMKL